MTDHVERDAEGKISVVGRQSGNLHEQLLNMNNAVRCMACDTTLTNACREYHHANASGLCSQHARTANNLGNDIWSHTLEQ